jgi:hypothetical protein
MIILAAVTFATMVQPQTSCKYDNSNIAKEHYRVYGGFEETGGQLSFIEAKVTSVYAIPCPLDDPSLGYIDIDLGDDPQADITVSVREYYAPGSGPDKRGRPKVRIRVRNAVAGVALMGTVPPGYELSTGLSPVQNDIARYAVRYKKEFDGNRKTVLTNDLNSTSDTFVYWHLRENGSQVKEPLVLPSGSVTLENFLDTPINTEPEFSGSWSFFRRI